MVNFKPFLKIRFFPTKIRLKLKLGVLLLSLSLLSNYQPAFNFPPVKSNIVYAEVTQTPTIEPQNLGVTFQLPHPGYITTTFSSFHPGIDLCSGLGMPIKPIAGGKVKSAGFTYFGLGLVVEVDHGNGFTSLYAHMGKIFVETGKEVGPNDFLGEIGMTGHTSGPHTHLEIEKDGKKIDPLLILPEIRKYPTEQDFVTINSSTPSAIAIPQVQPASKSAVINLPQSTTSSQIKTSLLEEIKESKEETTEIKTDLKQIKLDHVLNFSPKPVSAPIPTGGQFTLKNFTLFGFKKS